jgi:hypothetical protein
MKWQIGSHHAVKGDGEPGNTVKDSIAEKSNY